MAYLAFLFYAGTIAAAVAGTQTFFVLGLADVLALMPSILFAPVYVLCRVYSYSLRAGIALAHVMIAVLIHPATSLPHDEALSYEEQELVLRGHVTYSKSVPDHMRMERLLILARSMRDDELRRTKDSSPVYYWASPASVVLVIWGCILFFRLPRGPGQEDRHSVSNDMT